MSSKLILTLDGEIVKEYILDQNNISIGRKHENDIQLNDLTVSGRHALISNYNGTISVEDLGSTNGTLVNGNHVAKSSLNHGDVIQIGHHMFTYMTDASQEYEPTMFVRAEMDETQMMLPEWEMNDRAVNMRGQPLAGLRKINDPLGNMGIEMRKRFSTIGFQGKKLALINRADNGYTVVGLKSTSDRRSTDIPLLNGIEVGTKPLDLKEKDRISIAGIDMEFYYIH